MRSGLPIRPKEGDILVYEGRTWTVLFHFSHDAEVLLVREPRWNLPWYWPVRHVFPETQVAWSKKTRFARWYETLWHRATNLRQPKIDANHDLPQPGTVAR
jgi:hypothetical protein